MSLNDCCNYAERPWIASTKTFLAPLCPVLTDTSHLRAIIWVVYSLHASCRKPHASLLSILAVAFMNHYFFPIVIKVFPKQLVSLPRAVVQGFAIF